MNNNKTKNMIMMSEKNNNKIKIIQTSEKEEEEKNYSDFFANMVSHSPQFQKDAHGKFFNKDLDY